MHQFPSSEIPNALRAFGPIYRARLGGRRERGCVPVRARRSGRRSSTRATSATFSRSSGTACSSHWREDRPTFIPMGRDERVIRDRYNDQDPLIVADQLEVPQLRSAAEFAGLSAEQWERTGIYNWPTSSERSMVWLGRHTIHEGSHHLRDIDGRARPRAEQHPRTVGGDARASCPSGAVRSAAVSVQLNSATTEPPVAFGDPDRRQVVGHRRTRAGGRRRRGRTGRAAGSRARPTRGRAPPGPRAPRAPRGAGCESWSASRNGPPTSAATTACVCDSSSE